MRADRRPGADPLPAPARRARRRASSRFFAGCFGIFGHGNIAGIGQALQQDARLLRYYQARNEQAMVHIAVGYAKTAQPAADAWPARRRSGRARRTWSPARRWPPSTACRCCCCRATSSPRATPRPVLQQLESEHVAGHLGQRLLQAGLAATGIASTGPSRCSPALPEAMRVLTDPAETGAVTLALPQDVQTEAFDYPDGVLRAARLDDLPRNRPDRERAGARPPSWIRGSAAAADRRRRRRDLQPRRPTRCAASSSATGIPVGETQAGKGSLPLRPPAQPGRGRRDRHARRQPRSPATPTW